MELFFYDARALTLSVPSSRGGRQTLALPLIEAPLLPDRMPFFVTEIGDREPIHILNAFLRRLPLMACPSEHTWRAYALDIHSFARFLDERFPGVSILSVTIEHLARYNQLRRTDGRSTVSPETWNRSLQGLTKFYVWAHREGHVAALPFEFQDDKQENGRDRRHTGPRNTMRERVRATDEVRCVDLKEYLYFRDVGLCGYDDVDGNVTENFPMRCVQRNRAFAEFLITTGARLTESASLLVAELPSVIPGSLQPNLKMHLAAGVTKLGKPRSIVLPSRVLAEVHDYVAGGREQSIARRTLKGGYEVDEHFEVASSAPLRCRLVDGTEIRYELIVPRQRRMLLLRCGAGEYPHVPMALWLSQDGSAIQPSAFETIFARARARCERSGRTTAITPHTLRHTFAVCMLSELVKLYLGSVVKLRNKAAHVSEEALFGFAFDPLARLALLMGHQSTDTTRKYLTYLAEPSDMVDAAIASYADRFAATVQAAPTCSEEASGE